MSKKVAVVVGNFGVSFCVVKALCKHFGENGLIYYTNSNEEDLMQAEKIFKKEGLNPRFHLLDVVDVASIEKLRDDIKAEHGSVDILVNNVSIPYKARDASIPMSEVAAGIMEKHYHVVLQMTNTFLPIIRDGGRITHVASIRAADAYYEMSEELQKRFKEVSTISDVTDLMKEFIEATKIGDHTNKGWVDWPEGTCDLGVAALTKVQGEIMRNDPSKKDVLINCCCPGDIPGVLPTVYSDKKIATDKLTLDEGAITPVYLSLLPAGTKDHQGKLFSKKKVQNFFEENIYHPSYLQNSPKASHSDN